MKTWKTFVVMQAMLLGSLSATTDVDLEKALAQANKEGKPLLLDFYTEW